MQPVQTAKADLATVLGPQSSNMAQQTMANIIENSQCETSLSGDVCTVGKLPCLHRSFATVAQHYQINHREMIFNKE